MERNIVSATITYDGEGRLCSVITYTDGRYCTVPYDAAHGQPAVTPQEIASFKLGESTVRQQCPFCHATLHHSHDLNETYCVNNACPPRLWMIIARQLHQLELSPAITMDEIVRNLYLLPPPSRTLIGLMHHAADKTFRMQLVQRLSVISFNDFLVLLHVPQPFIDFIEDDASHCRTLKELYGFIIRRRGHLKASDVYRVAELACVINGPYAMMLMEHNVGRSPLWT